MAGWDSSFWLTAWSWEPVTIIGIAIILVGYFLISFPFRKQFSNSDLPKTTQVIMVFPGHFSCHISSHIPYQYCQQRLSFQCPHGPAYPDYPGDGAFNSGRYTWLANF